MSAPRHVDSAASHAHPQNTTRRGDICAIVVQDVDWVIPAPHHELQVYIPHTRSTLFTSPARRSTARELVPYQCVHTLFFATLDTTKTGLDSGCMRGCGDRAGENSARGILNANVTKTSHSHAYSHAEDDDDDKLHAKTVLYTSHDYAKRRCKEIVTEEQTNAEKMICASMVR